MACRSRTSSVVHFARVHRDEYGLDVDAISARAQAAADEYGVDCCRIPDDKIATVLGSPEHAKAFLDAREKNFARYG